MLWSSIQKRRKQTNINERVKEYIYSWIIQYPQVVEYPIANDHLKVSIDGHFELRVVPKLLIQVSVLELHDIMARTPE